MRIVFFIEVWNGLKVVLDNVINDVDIIIIICCDFEDVVVMLLDYYNSFMEIVYLFCFLVNVEYLNCLIV